MNKKIEVINPLGTYIKSMASYDASYAIKVPIKDKTIILLSEDQINKHYRVKVLYRNEWIYGYVLVDDVKIIY